MENIVDPVAAHQLKRKAEQPALIHLPSIKVHFHALIISSFLTRCVKFVTSGSFLPGSRFIVIWDLVLVAVILVVCWIYSYQAGFTHHKPGLGYMGSVGGNLLLVLTYLLDCLFIVDIFVSTKRAVITYKGC